MGLLLLLNNPLWLPYPLFTDINMLIYISLDYQTMVIYFMWKIKPMKKSDLLQRTKTKHFNIACRQCQVGSQILSKKNKYRNKKQRTAIYCPVWKKLLRNIGKRRFMLVLSSSCYFILCIWINYVWQDFEESL